MTTRRRIPDAGVAARAGAPETFGVVIPALDEAASIAAAVARVRRAPQVVDVVVVDGGSRDATCERAAAAGARVISARRGRGTQMNAGARCVSGDALVFLHADCELPPGAFDAMCDVLHRGLDAGVFAIDYAARHPLLRLLSALSRRQTAWTEFGEAALFVRRARFESLGGFRDWPLFEDVDLLARLRRAGTLGRARGQVHASPRRYEAHGVWRQQALSVVLFVLFRLGVQPTTLARWYERGGRRRRDGGAKLTPRRV